MPTDALQTSDRLVFEGALSPSVAIAVGLIVAAIAGWIMWRERQSVGLMWATIFWSLRVAAVAIALWMLAGPVHESVERSKTKQSIAILTDASQSMDTIDAPEATELLRWTAASSTEPELAPVAVCDRIQLAIQVANDSCEHAQRALTDHKPLKQIRQLVTEIRVAAARAEQHCDALMDRLNDRREDFADRFARLNTLLRGPLHSTLEDAAVLLEDRDVDQVGALTDRFEVLSDHLQSIARRIATITRELATELALDPATESDNDSAELTRREHSLNVLQALHQGVLQELGDEVRIRKFQFDSALTPIASERSWSEAAEIGAVGEEDEDEEAGPASSTDLTAVLRQLATDRVAESTRVAILLTDGNHTADIEEQPIEVASQIGDLPVYTVPIGNTKLVRDLRLHRIEAPSTVVENDSGIIDAIVTAFDCDGLMTNVILRHDGQEIDRQQLTFAGDRVDRRVQFTVTADENRLARL